jgi:anti-sigma regulatory factor (Ser/Thr protein kinase)
VSGRRSFPATVSSVGAARRFVGSELGSVPQSVVEAVAIAVSELATNCVRHAGTEFTVDVERTADRLRVEVADTGGGVPAVRTPGATEHSGRGLFLVRALTDDWGVSPALAGPGKSVWFTIGLPAPSGARV